MKELSVEEKAKRYDEVIRKAKITLDCCGSTSIVTQHTVYDIFPELKESEDERIKKELIKLLRNLFNNYSYFIKDPFYTECIAWLEKQGKKELENYGEAEKEKVDFVGDGFIECHADFLDFKEGETYWLEYIGDDKYNVRSDNLLGKTYHITPCQLYTVFKKLTWLEKQREKPYGRRKVGKPIVKVEPKFKVGDWIMLTAGELSTTLQIVKVNANKKLYWFNDCSYLPIVDEECLHLWTIKDAKDGDVLVSQYGKPFIYNGNHDSSTVGSYCGITVENRFDVAAEKYRWTENVNIQPATQEQRDALMKAMFDVGYTFDFKKKELKRIEETPYLE